MPLTFHTHGNGHSVLLNNAGRQAFDSRATTHAAVRKRLQKQSYAHFKADSANRHLQPNPVCYYDSAIPDGLENTSSLLALDSLNDKQATKKELLAQNQHRYKSRAVASSVLLRGDQNGTAFAAPIDIDLTSVTPVNFSCEADKRCYYPNNGLDETKFKEFYKVQFKRWLTIQYDRHMNVVICPLIGADEKWLQGLPPETQTRAKKLIAEAFVDALKDENAQLNSRHRNHPARPIEEVIVSLPDKNNNADPTLDYMNDYAQNHYGNANQIKLSLANVDPLAAAQLVKANDPTTQVGLITQSMVIGDNYALTGEGKPVPASEPDNLTNTLFNLTDAAWSQTHKANLAIKTTKYSDLANDHLGIERILNSNSNERHLETEFISPNFLVGLQTQANQAEPDYRPATWNISAYQHTAANNAFAQIENDANYTTRIRQSNANITQALQERKATGFMCLQGIPRDGAAKQQNYENDLNTRLASMPGHGTTQQWTVAKADNGATAHQAVGPNHAKEDYGNLVLYDQTNYEIDWAATQQARQHYLNRANHNDLKDYTSLYVFQKKRQANEKVLVANIDHKDPVGDPKQNLDDIKATCDYFRNIQNYVIAGNTGLDGNNRNHLTHHYKSNEDCYINNAGNINRKSNYAIYTSQNLYCDAKVHKELNQRHAAEFKHDDYSYDTEDIDKVVASYGHKPIFASDFDAAHPQAYRQDTHHDSIYHTAIASAELAKDSLISQIIFNYLKAKIAENPAFDSLHIAIPVNVSDHVELITVKINFDPAQRQAFENQAQAFTDFSSFAATPANAQAFKALIRNPDVTIIGSTESQYIGNGASSSPEAKARYAQVQAMANHLGAGVTVKNKTPFFQTDLKGGSGNGCGPILVTHALSFLNTGEAEKIPDLALVSTGNDTRPSKADNDQKQAQIFALTEAKRREYYQRTGVAGQFQLKAEKKLEKEADKNEKGENKTKGQPTKAEIRERQNNIRAFSEATGYKMVSNGKSREWKSHGQTLFSEILDEHGRTKTFKPSDSLESTYHAIFQRAQDENWTGVVIKASSTLALAKLEMMATGYGLSISGENKVDPSMKRQSKSAQAGGGMPAGYDSLVPSVDAANNDPRFGAK